MALNERQKRAYQHRCDIWTAARTVDGTTKLAGNETWTLTAANVPCMYEYTDNYSEPFDGVGRVKRPTILTTDIIHLEASQPAHDGCLVVNVTNLPDGEASPVRPEIHRLEGAGHFTPLNARRQANKQRFFALTVEHAPATLRSYYGFSA